MPSGQYLSAYKSASTLAQRPGSSIPLYCEAWQWLGERCPNCFTTGQVAWLTNTSVHICASWASKNSLPLIKVPGYKQPFRLWTEQQLAQFKENQNA